jgi:hypothetical protein
MNPFVNLMKRGVQLSDGAKDAAALKSQASAVMSRNHSFQRMGTSR